MMIIGIKKLKDILREMDIHTNETLEPADLITIGQWSRTLHEVIYEIEGDTTEDS